MNTRAGKPHRFIVILVLLLVIGFGCYKLIMFFLPDNVNPFQPLRIADKPTFVTKTKINRLKSHPDECIAVLENSTLTFEKIEDQKTGENCAYKNVAMLQQSGISYGGDIILTCPALVALTIWERHDLQPLAIKLFNQKIIRVRHYGTYACRNINNARQGRRSQHAYANAIDIAGFVLADGREISVLKDWGKDSEKGTFLTAIHQSACKRFSTVLGPNYNDLHKNHFHFDQGTWSICR